MYKKDGGGLVCQLAGGVLGVGGDSPPRPKLDRSLGPPELLLTGRLVAGQESASQGYPGSLAFSRPGRLDGEHSDGRGGGIRHENIPSKQIGFKFVQRLFYAKLTLYRQYPLLGRSVVQRDLYQSFFCRN